MSNDGKEGIPYFLKIFDFFIKVIHMTSKSLELMDDADRKKPIFIDSDNLVEKIIRKYIPGGSIDNPIEIENI